MDGIATRAAGGAACAALGADLAKALAQGGAGLRLDLEPICAAASLAPVGYEALLRWEHPARGSIAAAEVLAIAAATGLAPALDAWVLVTAFRHRAGWRPGAPYLAVNVSMAGVLHGHAAPMVRAAWQATGVDPRSVSIELPEAAAIRDPVAARDLTAGLRGDGIAVALDGFGNASGSILALRDIPVSTVKLGPLLTAGIERPRGKADRVKAVVAATVDTAHALGATVVAEAVETVDRMQALREAGCDALQGWLLARADGGR
jgi:EAL domain-containing protein (putative c-di-GMP-specific phosphodiesterase class I)